MKVRCATCGKGRMGMAFFGSWFAKCPCCHKPNHPMLSELKFVLFAIAKLYIAAFKVVGYTLVYAARAIWFAARGRLDKSRDAMASLGRGMVDAIADIFRK